jgi:tetratricopeptide (TPR) repeat protein
LYESSPSAGSLRPLPFKARDWVLVASFENRTGEPLFDGTVEYALEREIAESRYVNVVPRQRVVDALRLMRKPPDTRVDSALGREICVRDGGIRALLTGQIEKPGSNYLLSIGLVDPKSGAVVSSFAEEAAGRSRIPEVLRRSSHRLREILGEVPALIRQSEEKLASVTTPSLTALQLYSKADALMAQGQPGGAEELLKRAVAEDPRFASAHIHLAWVVRNEWNPEQDWRPAAERAFELSAGTSERERLFIRGSYYQMTGQFKKAKASYEALVSLYPDHYWASFNLVATLWQLGQPAAAADYAARIADLNPRGFRANFVAASCLLSEGRYAASETYRLRAESLLSPETIGLNPGEVAALRLLPAYGLWLRGEVSKALETLSRYATGKELLQSDVWEIANFYLLLGRLRDAEEWFRRVEGPIVRETCLAMIAFDRGDIKAMGRYLQRVTDPYLLARAGLISEAERQMTAMENLGSPRTNELDIVRGEIALARGRREEGIALLRRGLRTQGDAAYRVSLMGSESLAGALEKDGKLGEAVEILERLAEAKGRACVIYGGEHGALWMRTRLQLAGLYRRLGREQEARRIDDELRKLLAYADPDHQLVRELNRSESAAKISAKAR